MSNSQDIEQTVRRLDERISELEQTVGGRHAFDGLERQLEELERTVEGHGGLENKVESLERDVEKIKRELGIR